MPKSDGYKNLIPLNRRPKAEQRKIQEKGGEGNKKAIARKKTLQELTKMILDNPVVSEEAKEQIKALFPDANPEDITNGMAMIANIMYSAITSKELKDKVKAAEFLRDTSGQKPATTVDGAVTVEKVFITKEEEKQTLKHIKEVIAKKEG